MCHVTFQNVADDEARIFADGEYVGDLFRHRDILNPGSPVYVVHLSEDPRGFVRVHERSRIREVAEQRLLSHPLFG